MRIYRLTGRPSTRISLKPHRIVPVAVPASLRATSCRSAPRPSASPPCAGTRPRARIVIEASTDSEWVARCLEALGHEVIVADPDFAPMYAARRAHGEDRPTRCAGPGEGVPARGLPPRPSALRSPAARAGPRWVVRDALGPDAHARHLGRPGPAPPARLPPAVRQCGRLCRSLSGPVPAGPLALGGRAAARPHASPQPPGVVRRPWHLSWDDRKTS